MFSVSPQAPFGFLASNRLDEKVDVEKKADEKNIQSGKPTSSVDSIGLSRNMLYRIGQLAITPCSFLILFSIQPPSFTPALCCSSYVHSPHPSPCHVAIGLRQCVPRHYVQVCGFGECVTALNNGRTISGPSSHSARLLSSSFSPTTKPTSKNTRGRDFAIQVRMRERGIHSTHTHFETTMAILGLDGKTGTPQTRKMLIDGLDF